MLTPTQIQKLISQYYTADFEVSYHDPINVLVFVQH
jgi:hypothetical protein